MTTGIVTISEPTTNEQLLRVYNERMKASNNKELGLNRKYAICLISLDDTFDQPDNYQRLQDAVVALRGVTKADLLIDGKCPSAIPAGKKLVMVVEAHLRIDNA